MPEERTQPLRPYDPRTLGVYELVGRLGEGGMGTVYLGRTVAGALVAVKVVRADLAPDDEFRRRFRSEVARARQVPPFCTAEVLDADPDHERPYLVVEYVDGPTLAHVVEERGPLTSANLHSVAIGVATALTAIHGAGVIHRDLKPRNVLLAPGSPKVIDFGIARAAEGASAITSASQMVGTVAYMAPERFGEPDAPLTPAADVFAWGGVVAYAGTGRTPFAADSPPATAARILTRPPDLSGLSGQLRDLVARALEKDPADRPSARELLDLLVSGPSRPAATAAALADQPGLRAAAKEAQAVTGVRSGSAGADAAEPAVPEPAVAGLAASEPAVSGSAVSGSAVLGSAVSGSAVSGSAVSGSAVSGSAVSGSAVAGPGVSEWGGPGSGGPGSTVSETAPTALVGYVEDAIVTMPISPPPVGAPSAAPPPAPPRRRWPLPAAVAFLVTAMVVGTAMVAYAVRQGTWPRAVVPSPSVAGPTVPAGELLIADPLVQQRLWLARSVAKEGSCSFDGGLVAERDTPGPYRCAGPMDSVPAAFRVEVTARLLTRDSCASIWFRFKSTPYRGYQVRFCETHVYFGTHKEQTVETTRTYALDSPIPLNTPTMIGVQVVGDSATVTRDGQVLGSTPLTDPQITAGRVILGLYTERDAPPAGPYSVAFNDVEIWGLG